jgi:hypothetical protein
MKRSNTSDAERVEIPIDTATIYALGEQLDRDDSLTLDEQLTVRDTLHELADDIEHDRDATHELVIEFKRAPCGGCLSLHAGIAMLNALGAL